MAGLSAFNCEIAEENGEKAVDHSLLCPICKELMNQPVSISCGHSACKACLQQSIAKNKKSCPICRVDIDNLNTNIAVKSMISKINVRCTNSGCAWVGKHHEKENHWDNCPFLLMQCPNGCIGSQPRSALDQHLVACPYQRLPCGYCNVRVPRYHLETHMENCPESPRLCPLQCGERLPRSHIHMHLGDCPRRAVKCEVRGCNNYFALGAHYEHDRQYQESHQVLLKNEVERLRGIVFDKADEKIERVLHRRKSFLWTIKLADVEDGKDAASPYFKVEGDMFRCIWLKTSTPQRMMLEQVISSKPITMTARFSLIRDGDVTKQFETRVPKTISEGFIGTDVDFGPLRNDQELQIKVSIAIYTHI